MRRALLIAVPLVVLGTAAWFFLMFSPTSARIAQAELDLETAMQEETTLRAQVAKLQKIQDNELAYLDAVGQIEASVPPTPQLDVLINDLTALAEKNGLVWNSFAPGVPVEVEGQPYMSIPVTVSVDGQYFEILGYLFDINDLARLITIDTITISSTQDEDNFTVLSVSISGQAYTTSGINVPNYGPPPEAAIPIEETPPPEEGAEGEGASTTTVPES
jgi:type IV pilus assembly protein PilO